MSELISLVIAFALVMILLVAVGIIWDIQMRKKQREAQAKEENDREDSNRITR